MPCDILLEELLSMQRMYLQDFLTDHRASAVQDVKMFHQAARGGNVQLIRLLLAIGTQADMKWYDVSGSH